MEKTSIPHSIYELFSNIFAKEPTIEFLRLLQKEENQKLLRSHDMDCLSDIKHLPIEQQVESLAIEYTRLFLMPQRPASPHESIQRGEGRLWGKSTAEVDKIYKRFGFKLDEGFKDTPDHISAELSFLAQLTRLESEYDIASLMDVKKGVLEVKKSFLKNHILEWFPGFRDGIIKAARLSYYKEMVRFLDEVLNKEREELKDV